MAASILAVLVALAGAHCQVPVDASIGESQSASTSACGSEAATTFDGYPAFSWCSAGDTIVYSSDGYTVSPSSGSVKTGYGGQCVELAQRYFYFKWGVQPSPGNAIWGANAGDMCSHIPSGACQVGTAGCTTSAMPGDLVVFPGGSTCSAYTFGASGHVAVINSVGSGVYKTTAQNGWANAGYQTWGSSCSGCVIHAKSNGGGLTDPKVFDAEFYLHHYADLLAAFGDNPAAAQNHWLTFGINEGRRASRQFDVNYYLNTYADLKNAFGTNYKAALNHWLTVGLPNEGRRGSREFDVAFYLAWYGDLKAAFGTNYKAAAEHWLTPGLPNEGRRGSLEFDVQYYLSAYSDLRAAFGTNYTAAIDHWINNGIAEGRRGYSAPGAPTSLSPSGGTWANPVPLSWSASAGATSYNLQIQYYNGSSWQVETSINGIGSSSYSFNAAHPGSGYYFWATACNGNGCSAWSNGAGFTAAPPSRRFGPVVPIAPAF